MCCAFFWFRKHPQLLLLIAFNRDEYVDRSAIGGLLPAAAAMKDHPVQARIKSSMIH